MEAILQVETEEVEKLAEQSQFEKAKFEETSNQLDTARRGRSRERKTLQRVEDENLELSEYRNALWAELAELEGSSSSSLGQRAS